MLFRSAPHHGGKTANPEALYRWARPRSVVVSQRPPALGTDALAPLERQGIPLWRTWRDGAVRLRWTSQGIVASGFLDDGAGRTKPVHPGIGEVE